MRVCNKCNKVFDDTWKVCLYCSQDLEFKEGEYHPVPMPEKPKKSTWKRDLSIFLSTIGLFLLLFWGLCGKFWGLPKLF